MFHLDTKKHSNETIKNKFSIIRSNVYDDVMNEDSRKSQKSKYRENKIFLQIKSFVHCALNAILQEKIMNILAKAAFKILYQSVERNWLLLVEFLSYYIQQVKRH